MSHKKQRMSRAQLECEGIGDDIEIGTIKIEPDMSTDYESSDEAELPALKPRIQEHLVKKRTHKSQQQYEIFLKFMTENPSIAKGFVKGDRLTYDGIWAGLVAKLNAVGPPTKDMQAWKKVWSDCKLAIKKKLTNNMEAIARDGSPYMQVALSPAETSIATLCDFYKIVNDGQVVVTQPHNVRKRLSYSNNQEMEFPGPEESSPEDPPKRDNKRLKTENLEAICGTQNVLMQNIVSSLDAIRSNVEKQTSLMAQHYKNLEEIERKKLEALQKILKS